MYSNQNSGKKKSNNSSRPAAARQHAYEQWIRTVGAPIGRATQGRGFDSDHPRPGPKRRTAAMCRGPLLPPPRQHAPEPNPIIHPLIESSTSPTGHSWDGGSNSYKAATEIERSERSTYPHRLGSARGSWRRQQRQLTHCLPPCRARPRPRPHVRCATRVGESLSLSHGVGVAARGSHTGRVAFVFDGFSSTAMRVRVRVREAGW